MYGRVPWKSRAYGEFLGRFTAPQTLSDKDNIFREENGKSESQRDEQHHVALTEWIPSKWWHLWSAGAKPSRDGVWQLPSPCSPQVFNYTEVKSNKWSELGKAVLSPEGGNDTDMRISQRHQTTALEGVKDGFTWQWNQRPSFLTDVCPICSWRPHKLRNFTASPSNLFYCLIVLGEVCLMLRLNFPYISLSTPLFVLTITTQKTSSSSSSLKRPLRYPKAAARSCFTLFCCHRTAPARSLFTQGSEVWHHPPPTTIRRTLNSVLSSHSSTKRSSVRAAPGIPVVSRARSTPACSRQWVNVLTAAPTCSSFGISENDRYLSGGVISSQLLPQPLSLAKWFRLRVLCTCPLLNLTLFFQAFL